MRSVAYLTILLSLPAVLLVMPVRAAVLDWDAPGVDWPTRPPGQPADFGPVTFYNVDGSGIDIRITIQDGGVITSSGPSGSPGSPQDSAFLTGGLPSGQNSNLFIKQITNTSTSSTIMTVEFLGGTAGNIEVRAFDIDASINGSGAFRDIVKVTASDGTSTMDPSSINTFPNNTTLSQGAANWFNSNFPGAGVTPTNSVAGTSSTPETDWRGDAQYFFSQTGIAELELEYWNSWEEEGRGTNGIQWIGFLNQLSFDAVVVPEPSMLCLLAVGGVCAIGIVLCRRWKRRTARVLKAH